MTHCFGILFIYYVFVKVCKFVYCPVDVLCLDAFTDSILATDFK